ncbi:MAG: HAMP domain-containing histidine kinase [Gemmatimonadota bacterium]|nr:MAG: HAMP domain-containing histidine kinase [Gemmatimonadota bacterium]
MRQRRLPFATRLFFMLFLLSAVPSVALLGLATWGLRNYVELAGGAGAWRGVSDTGRDLLEAVEGAGADSLVRAAAAEHEEELSRSVRLARRWDLIAGRLARALPWVALVLGLSLAAVAALAARQLARGLGRPVSEVVDWAGRVARAEPLPRPRAADAQGPPEFAVLRDAFRHMAERLAEGRRQALEAERLRGLTEMARRVAHEIKNPLTPLMLALRQARHLAGRGQVEELDEPLRVIAAEAERLDEMARSFSQLGRLPEGPTSEIDLEEMLGELMASDLPDSVTGTLTADAALPRVEGHLAALSRAFRNLLGNAVDALGDRPDARIDVTITSSDATVEVAIADNGPGVPAEHRERIWDPDFTTRKKGTGLGLALVRQTVRAHGGEIELRSSDEGACFVVRLPVRPRSSG